jgi:chromosome segregation ATPase
MTDKNDNNDVELQIKLLEKDVIANSEHTARLDEVVHHLKDLAESMTKMIAIHEEKHAQHDKEEQRLTDLLSENTQELKDIEDKLERHKDTLHKRISESEKTICSKIDNKFKERNTKRNELEDRVSKLERVYWMTMGGIAVIGTIITLVKFLIG